MTKYLFAACSFLLACSPGREPVEVTPSVWTIEAIEIKYRQGGPEAFIYWRDSYSKQLSILVRPAADTAIYKVGQSCGQFVKL